MMQSTLSIGRPTKVAATPSPNVVRTKKGPGAETAPRCEGGFTGRMRAPLGDDVTSPYMSKDMLVRGSSATQGVAKRMKETEGLSKYLIDVALLVGV